MTSAEGEVSRVDGGDTSVEDRRAADRKQPRLDLPALLLHWKKVTQRVERGRQLLESLRDYMKDRAAVETSHVNELRRTLERLEKWVIVTESSGVADLVKCLRSDLDRRAACSSDLADAIRHDIIEATLTVTIANHSGVFRQMLSDVASIARDLRAATAKVDQGKSDICAIGRELLQLTLNFQQAKELTSGSHIRLASRLLKCMESMRGAQADYARSVETLNGRKKLFRRQLEIVTQSLVDMDKKRLACMKDALRKLLIYQTSQLRNSQYDTDNLIKFVEHVDEDKELDEFYGRLDDNKGAVPDALDLSLEEVATQSWIDLVLPLHRGSSPTEVDANHEDGSLLPGKIVRGMSTAFTSPEEAVRQILARGDEGPRAVIADLDPSAPPGGNDHLAPKYVSRRVSACQEAERRASASVASVASQESVSGESRKRADAADADTPAVRKCSTTDHPVSRAQVWSEYEDLIDSLWNAADDVCLQSVALHLGEHRDSLCSQFHRHCVTEMLYHKMRKGELALPNMSALRLLGILATVLLDWCDMQWDVSTARSWLVFAQVFHAYGNASEEPRANFTSWKSANPVTQRQSHFSEASPTMACPHDGGVEVTEESPPKQEIPWFLHRAIYHLVIWNRVRFWEEALIITLCEYRQQEMIREIRETVSASKWGDVVAAKVLNRPTVCQHPAPLLQFADHWSIAEKLLLHYGQCMRAFGIAGTRASELIQRVCLEHNVAPSLAKRLLAPLAEDCAGGNDISERIFLPLAPFATLAHPQYTSAAYAAERFGTSDDIREAEGVRWGAQLDTWRQRGETGGGCTENAVS